MNKVLSSLTAMAGLTAAMWFSHIPASMDAKYFATDSNGNLIQYTRDTVDGQGAAVTLKFDKAAQSQLWTLSKLFPRPVK